MKIKQQVGECWVYVIFFACACGVDVRLSALRLTIPVDTFTETTVRLFWLFLAILGNFLKIRNLISVKGLESIF